ncbi:MAG: hypothetical protein J0M15_15120 [Deltaproteobacteria bacterium]|nr:hypothetical protein [Deltaproteobacteria bacterium]
MKLKSPISFSILLIVYSLLLFEFSPFPILAQNPGMGAPGMGAPGMGAPGMGAPGMGAPGMGAPGMGGFPGMGAPGMGGFPGQQNPNAVYAGVLDNCPFSPPTSSEVSGLMRSLTAALVQLKNECPSLDSTIRQLENEVTESSKNIGVLLNLKSSTEMSLSSKLPSPDISQVELDCSNYNLLLGREFDIVSDRLDKGETENIPLKYQKCKSYEGQEKRKCISDSFSNSVTIAKRNCQTTYSAGVQQNIKKSISSISQGFTQLFDKAQTDCRAGSGETISQTFIGLAESFTALPGALGLAGVGINVLANLVSSFFRQKNYESSPISFLKTLSKQKDIKNQMCLWFQFQNKGLNCKDHFRRKDLQIANDNLNLCPQYFSGALPNKQLTNISSLSHQLSRFPGSPVQPAQKIDFLDALLKKNITDPINAENTIPLKKHLETVAKELMTSNGESKRSDITLGRGLQKLLELHDKMDTLDSSSKNPKYEEDLKGLNKSIEELLKSFSLESAIDSYWTLKEKEDSYNLIKHLAFQDTESNSESFFQYSGDENDYRLGLNGMVKHFQEPLGENLELLAKRYESSISEGSPNGIFTSSIELAKACFMNAGLFYAQKPDNLDDLFVKDPLRRIQQKPTKQYENACKVFSCFESKTGNSAGSLFKPDPDERKNSEKFRDYQCQNLKNYDIIISKIKTQIQDRKKLCD